MNWDEFFEIIYKIKYKDWVFALAIERDKPFLQIIIPNGINEPLKCRKWLLSGYMTKSEFVQTCFKAVMTAEEHEIREEFKYRDKQVFGPHFDVDFLVENIKIDVRK